MAARVTVASIKEYAVRTHTPRQFRRLLRDLRSVVPYRGLACISCNPATHRVVQMLDVDYPRQYLGWYLATGMVRTDPLFQECLKTQQPQLRSDLLSSLPHAHRPDHVKKIREFQLQYEIQGVKGVAEREGMFSVVLNGEQEARTALRPLGELLPALFRALVQSYRYPVLTDRKRTILLWRAQGMRPALIAAELGISPRTVKLHTEEIIGKLYAEDLVHAVWIAGQIGIIG
ncbi:LuxR C-terminal-related transcriptional regulator [Candidatus Nitrospira bockiana]